MAGALKFKNANLPRQPGERARLKVVQGPELGVVYILTGQRASMGRGDDCDMILFDLKASRHHAEIAQTPAGWVLKDLGSANGVLHNGAATRGATIKQGDTVTVGETTLEFFTANAATQMLAAPPRPVHQIAHERSVLEAQRKKAVSFAGTGGAAGPRKAVLGLVVIAAGYLFFFDEPQSTAPKSPVAKRDTTQGAEARDLASFLPGSDSKSVDKTTEMFFRSGFREYREHNYIRAKTHFETVLQISPSHALARIYLENCNKSIDEEVKFHLEYGKKSQTSGKLKDARGHYEAVMRLLYRDQTAAGFVEAREQLEKLEKEVREGSS